MENRPETLWCHILSVQLHLSWKVQQCSLARPAISVSVFAVVHLESNVADFSPSMGGKGWLDILCNTWRKRYNIKKENKPIPCQLSPNRFLYLNRISNWISRCSVLGAACLSSWQRQYCGIVSCSHHVANHKMWVITFYLVYYQCFSLDPCNTAS